MKTSKSNQHLLSDCQICKFSNARSLQDDDPYVCKAAFESSMAAIKANSTCSVIVTFVIQQCPLIAG